MTTSPTAMDTASPTAPTTQETSPERVLHPPPHNVAVGAAPPSS